MKTVWGFEARVEGRVGGVEVDVTRRLAVSCPWLGSCLADWVVVCLLKAHQQPLSW